MFEGPLGARSRRHARLLSTLACLLAIAFATCAPSATAADAGQPTRTPVGASFIGFAQCTDGWTTWGIGVQFAHKPGAESYVVEYWDGYWQRTESKTMSHAQASEGDQYAKEEGSHYMGVTGGAGGHLGGGECGEVTQPDPGERFNQGAKAWAIMPANYRPKASLTVEVLLPEGGAIVGQTLDAKVRVTAGAEAAISDIKLGQGLLIAGSGASIVKRPATPTFRLAAGGSRTFTYRVKATGTGATTLKASATGIHTFKKERRTVRGSGTATLRVAREQLAISVGVAPEEKRLEATDDGKVQASTVDVTVRLTNAGTTAITKLTLQRLAPRPVKRGQRLDQIGFGLSSFPMTIGDIAPKSSVEKTLQLEVTGDGKYVFDVLAFFENAAGLGTEQTTSGEFEVVVPMLFFTSSIQGQQQVVKGGDPYNISGYVKNLSDYQPLCLRPLKPTKFGNADFFGPADLLHYRKGGVIAPPVAGNLDPGDRIPWELVVRTQRLGGTRSEITFDPGAAKVDAGDDCEIERVMRMKRLPESLVKLTPDSTEYRTVVDTSEATFPELGLDGKIYYVSGAILIGAGEGTGKMLQGTYATAVQIVEAGTTPENYFKAAMLPAQASTATRQALTNMFTATTILAEWWRNATPAEKARFQQEVQAEFRQNHSNAWKQAEQVGGAIAKDWLDDLERYERDHNDPEVWTALGKRGGSFTAQFVLDVAIGKAMEHAGVALARELALRRGDVLSAVHVSTSLKGIPAGKALNAVEMRNLWGMTAKDMAEFSRIAKKFDIKIAVRGRNPKSVAHINAGSVWKHENLKPKNVNRIDIDYLNFDEADDGLVAFKKYTDAEQAAIREKVANAGLDPEQLAEVNDRIDIRFKEAKEYLDAIEDIERKGVIDVRFDANGNGFEHHPEPKPRAFQLQRQGNPGETITYRPLQENPNYSARSRRIPKNCDKVKVRQVVKVLCSVTGDMDGVYITTPQNGPVDKAKIMEIYRELEAVGWQHPETVTWVKDLAKGGFWFDSKAKILAGNTIGGEALAEFSKGGVFASYISIRRSRLVHGYSRDWFLSIVGGYRAVKT